MKTLGTKCTSAERFKQAREQVLDQYIQEMHTEIGASSTQPPKSYEDKDQYRQDLEQLMELMVLRDAMTMALAMEEELTLTKFHLFPLLPLELRQKIWEYCCLDHTKPRVHTIGESEHRIQRFLLSDQSISPLLHACKESRAHYIFVTKSTLAFHTYINFGRDIVYCQISNRISSRHDIDGKLEWFVACLTDPSFQKVQNFALERSTMILLAMCLGIHVLEAMLATANASLPLCREVYIIDDLETFNDLFNYRKGPLRLMSRELQEALSETIYIEDFIISMATFLGPENSEPIDFLFAKLCKPEIEVCESETLRELREKIAITMEMLKISL